MKKRSVNEFNTVQQQLVVTSLCSMAAPPVWLAEFLLMCSARLKQKHARKKTISLAAKVIFYPIFVFVPPKMSREGALWIGGVS